MNYTTQSLNKLNKRQIQAIAAQFEIEFQRDETKATLIEWIIFAQDQSQRTGEADEKETNNQPEDQTEIESTQPIEQPIEQTQSTNQDLEPPAFDLVAYEQNLILYLDQRSQSQDVAAQKLLEQFPQFKQCLLGLVAKPKRSRSTSSGQRSSSTPEQRIEQARIVWQAVQDAGNCQLAAQSVGKSAQYTKVISKAYELYHTSATIRAAYDARQIGWTQLYNVAFSNKKSDTIAVAESRINDLIKN